jgi:hypothetical protein
MTRSSKLEIKIKARYQNLNKMKLGILMARQLVVTPTLCYSRRTIGSIHEQQTVQTATTADTNEATSLLHASRFNYKTPNRPSAA